MISPIYLRSAGQGFKQTLYKKDFKTSKKRLKKTFSGNRELND